MLLVDDDAAVGVVCSLSLQAAAFDLTEAADGLHPPDLILSDRRMPGLDGFALAEALSGDQAMRAVPVVFPSGETGVAERTAPTRSGSFPAQPSHAPSDMTISSRSNRRVLNEVAAWNGSTYRRVVLLDDLPVDVAATQPAAADAPELRVTVTSHSAASRIGPRNRHGYATRAPQR